MIEVGEIICDRKLGPFYFHQEFEYILELCGVCE